MDMPDASPPLPDASPLLPDAASPDASPMPASNHDTVDADVAVDADAASLLLPSAIPHTLQLPHDDHSPVSQSSAQLLSSLHS